MGVRIEIDQELAARSVEELNAKLSDEAFKIASIEQELKRIGGEITEGIVGDDVEAPLGLMQRRRELPFRLLALQVRRAQIQIALCDVRMREGAPAIGEALSQFDAQEKLLRKAQEKRDLAFDAWFNLSENQKDLSDQMRALANQIRDMRDEQIRLTKVETQAHGAWSHSGALA